jgi:DNA-directed RNA polymerase alpha subunit
MDEILRKAIEEAIRNAEMRVREAIFSMTPAEFEKAKKEFEKMKKSSLDNLLGPEIASRPIEKIFNLKNKTHCRIRKAMAVLKIKTLGELISLDRDDFYRHTKNFGINSLQELERVLSEYNLHLK